eukprot:GILI01003860.1.p1 GENE.GILI01003860.1~~GILI01003860.1.p1  ORF type:complete len:706 (+),score=175.82 GILI01003860.1:3-2120(+)
MSNSTARLVALAGVGVAAVAFSAYFLFGRSGKASDEEEYREQEKGVAPAAPLSSSTAAVKSSAPSSSSAPVLSTPAPSKPSSSSSSSLSSSSSSSLSSSSSSAPSSSLVTGLDIIYPEAIDVFLELCKCLDRPDHKLKALHQLEHILDPVNLDRLADQPLLCWANNFVRGLMPESEMDAPALIQMHAIVLRILIHDLGRPTKNSRMLRWFAELTDAEDFDLQVIENLLDYFESAPHIPDDPNSTNSANVFRNLHSLFNSLGELVVLTPRLCLRIMGVINLLACHNTPDLRVQMKQCGLLELRDDLLLHCLREEFESDQDLLDVLSIFSFETVAVLAAKFREANGVLFLLKLLHERLHQRPILAIIADIIRNILGSNEENRRAVARIVEDPDVLSRLFSSPSYMREGGASGKGPSCLRPRTSDSESQDLQSFQDLSIEEFLDWYLSGEQDGRLKAVVQRINKQWASVQAVLKKQEEKQQSSRSKRRKEIAAKKIRNRQAVVSDVVEQAEKRRLKIERSEQAIVQRIEGEHAARVQRVTQGSTAWDRIRSYRTRVASFSGPAAVVASTSTFSAASASGFASSSSTSSVTASSVAAGGDYSAVSAPPGSSSVTSPSLLPVMNAPVPSSISSTSSLSSSSGSSFRLFFSQKRSSSASNIFNSAAESPVSSVFVALTNYSPADTKCSLCDLSLPTLRDRLCHEILDHSSS